MREHPRISSEAYRAGVQNLAGGVCLVTTGRGDDRRGFTATAVMSLSDDPPSLAVGVGSTNGSHDMICESGWFCVNVLADHQVSLANVFAGRQGLGGSDRFSQGEWLAGRPEAPMLNGALATFLCEMTDHRRYPTHSLIVGEVREMRHDGHGGPLLYWRRAYGRMGDFSAG
jgi:flavin reductase (DIM6/NTAB) family NADH-FMN oxidoreductase RutF